MRFITVNLSCDWNDCTVIAPEGEGLISEMTVAVDGKAPRTFCICKEHRDELEFVLAPLLALGLTEKGRAKTVAKTPSSSGGNGNDSETSAGDTETYGSVSCRVADCGRVLKGRTGMAQHAKKAHGLTLAEHDALPERGSTS